MEGWHALYELYNMTTAHERRAVTAAYNPKTSKIAAPLRRATARSITVPANELSPKYARVAAALQRGGTSALSNMCTQTDS